MPDTYRIVIAEDHEVVRAGLRTILAGEPDLEVVGEAGDGPELIGCLRQLQPDLVLLDLLLPRVNGLDAVKEVRGSGRLPRVVVLTAHDSEEHIFSALDAGADGFLVKGASLGELLLAIRSVLAGEQYLCPRAARAVIAAYHRSKASAQGEASELSTREREIVKLVAEGYRSRGIAELLCISPKTVEKHRSNLMRKLDLHTVAAVTSYALSTGLLERR